MKRIVSAALVCCSLLFASCGAVSSRLSLFEATILHSRGDDRAAISRYLRATPDRDIAPWADYGLGTIYLSMGETESALSRFESAVKGQSSTELRFRAHYNAGVTRYRRADFKGAIAEFRSALEVDPQRTEAKRNLELSLRELDRKQNMASAPSPVQTRDAGAENKALFDFIRQKEGDRWKSREWQAPSSSSLDY